MVEFLRYIDFELQKFRMKKLQTIITFDKELKSNEVPSQS